VSNDLQINYGEDGNVVESTQYNKMNLYFLPFFGFLAPPLAGNDTITRRDGALAHPTGTELVVALTERVKSVTEVDTHPG
jgi:hypothetical protein